MSTTTEEPGIPVLGISSHRSAPLATLGEDRLGLIAKEWKLKTASLLARRVVEASTRIESSAAADGFPPTSMLSRFLSNRVVPSVLRFAFRPGVHHVNGAMLWIPSPVSGGLGGEYHMAVGTYEKPEMQYVLNHLEVGAGMVDIGAHIGYYTIPAAAKVGPNGHIFAIEPTRRSVEILRRSIEINHFGDRVTVVEAAASEFAGFGNLVVSDISEMWNTLEPETLQSSAGSVEVPVVTVDHVLSEASWPRVDIMKMDVEGHERSVILGASETLTRYPNLKLIFEASGTTDERLRVSLETIRALDRLGYRFQFMDNDAGIDQSIETLVNRMTMPRWQDSLFNIVAMKPLTTAALA